MTNQYSKQPPWRFNKKVWPQEEARLGPQEVIRLTKSIDLVTLQPVGVPPNQTLHTYVPLQFRKDFKGEQSSRSASLLSNLEQQCLTVLARLSAKGMIK